MVGARNMIEAVFALAEILADLHRRMTPHAGQIPIGTAVFFSNIQRFFIQCGRSFGKSRIASYVVVRIARTRPNTTNYIFGPFIGQMKEIYWTPRLLHNLIPEDEIESQNATEMRITLKNGSFIKVCGAENYEAYRGVKLNPNSICVIEEMKDIRAAFLDAFMPNLSVNDPIVMMIGTPPNRENHFTMYAKQAQTDEDWFFYKAPSSVNPHVSPKFLADQEKFLRANGLEDVWLAEYMAEFVQGGHKAIFPMVAKRQVHKLADVMPKDINKWTMYVAADPASSSIFAVEMFLMNPFTKQIITCGEIYESKPENMTARAIYRAVEDLLKPFRELGVTKIEMTYDSASRWFANEIAEIEGCDWWLSPCDKSSGLDGEISCIRGVVSHNLVTFTDATPKLYWELVNYVKDEKGRLPDKDDHAWQAFAYGLKLAGFDYSETLEPKQIPLEDQRRGYSIEEDFGSDEGMIEI